ncbi:FecR family protein [Metapseudomonas otitidis]|uniref:FecR family protein n=1 Tax=Metapseudomonas otitidis TaxID=319939 RepID=UPI001F0EDB39|nr:FecR family protein [Pseudomonas otitidis]
MNKATSPATSDPLVEVAAHWCMRLHAEDCTAEERAEFQAWIDSDPANALEYAEMLEIWELSAHLPPSTVPSGSAARPTPPRLAPPPQQRPAPPVRRRGFLARHARALALAVVGLPLAAYSGWLAGWVPDSYHRYSADTSIQRFTLGDGSEVELNLGSRLSYASFIDQRRVELSRGEAYFHVSRDTQHPFVVNAGEGSITVTGTRFNVWTYQDNVVVTVTEGSVKVRSARHGNDSNLSPGMQAAFRPGDLQPHVGAADTSKALAWRNGKLVLDDLPLADALPLINRYLDHPLVLGDASVGEQRIGGIYSTQDIGNLVKALPKVLPIRLATRGDGRVVIHAR